MESIKKDQNKPGMHLLPGKPLQEIAKVMDFGAKKYDPHNWRKGMDWSRMYSALQRHLTEWNDNAGNDPETGLTHLAHAGCCILFLLEYELKGIGNDDRYKEPETTPSDVHFEGLTKKEQITFFSEE
jgi:hypothetical protein